MPVIEEGDEWSVLDRTAMSARNSDQKPGKAPGRCPSLKKKTNWIAPSFGDFPVDFAASSSNTQARKNKGRIASSGTAKGKKRPRESNSESCDTQGPESALCNRAASSTKTPQAAGNTYELWADKFTPKTQNDLAVHKKKISELEGWLQHVLNPSRKLKEAPVLLLTGPSGAGKTATLRVLAREQKVEVQEWTNPATAVYESDGWKPHSYGEYMPAGGPINESQTSLFQDFLLRANKYPSLQIFNQDHFYKKYILVEDFPNIFFRNTKKFHEILRDYRKHGHCPLVFIISDSSGGDSNERLLFPKEIQAELGIDNISFNPVAPTSLTKVLQRIASVQANESGRQIHVPSKDTISALAAASSGDVRGAINALQFACLKDTRDLEGLLSRANSCTSQKKQPSQGRSTSAKKSSSSGVSAGSQLRRHCEKSPEDGDTDLAAIGGRDTSLFLFRALGKILYCKRGAPKDFPDHAQLPDHLKEHYRDPLLIHTEDVLDKCQLSGDMFTAFLHQNYLEFYSQLDDVVQASEYFSDADHLGSDWVNRYTLKDYAASVASRGLMFCNSARALSISGSTPGLGWKPLHKPQWFTATKQVRNNCERASDLFRGSGWAPEELLTNLIPYLAWLPSSHQQPAQMSFVQEIGRFSSSKHQSMRHPEKLDEKDLAVMDGADEERLCQSASSSLGTSTAAATEPNAAAAAADDGQLKVQGEEEDEDIVIEEFED